MIYEAVSEPEQDRYEAILQRFDRYIVMQVHRLGCYYSKDIHPAVLDLEFDEIAQRVRIKLWQALAKRDIRYPYAYIKLIIQSEFIDMTRRHKSYLALPTDEQLACGEVGIATRNMLDPVEVVVQQMDASSRLKEIIQAVLALPPRQQCAVICSLKDRVDDLRQLVKAFKVYKIDIQAIQWPAEKADKQLLQASLIPAKKTLAKRLLVSLA